MKRIHKFIMYNNIIPIGVAVMFVGGAGAFAAQTVISDAEVTRATVEVNTVMLMKLDIDALNDELEIISIDDVDSHYEVTYRFNTLTAVDGVWKEVIKEDVLKVRNKDRFANLKELREYLNEELYEVVQQDRVFLARAQKEAQTESSPELSLALLTGDFDVEKPDQVVIDPQDLIAKSEGNIFTKVTGKVASIITISQGPVAVSNGTGNDVEGEVSTVTELNESVVQEEPEEEVATSTDETATTTEEVATSTEPVEEETSTTTATTTEPVVQEEPEEEVATSTDETATTTEEVATSTEPVEEETSTTTVTTTEPVVQEEPEEEVEEESPTTEEAATTTQEVIEQESEPEAEPEAEEIAGEPEEETASSTEE